MCNGWRWLLVHGMFLSCQKHLQTSAAVALTMILPRSSTNLPLLQKVAPWTLCGFNCMQAGKWPKRDHLGHLWLSLHHAHFLQPRINQNRRPCNEPMLLACKVSERKSSCQKSWKAIGWQVGCLHHWFAGRSGLPKFISQAASMEQCYFTMCPMQVHKKREYHLEELAAKCRLDCYLLETS